MKIDPRIQSPAEAQPGFVKRSGTPGVQPTGASITSGVKPATGEDTVLISSNHGDVQTLKAGLANVPEVRLDRVTALKQQVSAAQYHPDSGKVADSIIAEQASRTKTP